MSDLVIRAVEPLVGATVQVRDDGNSSYAFKFVQVGSPSRDCDEDSRSMVRSHVMRDFYVKRDKRRRSSNTLVALTPAISKDSIASQIHRFKVGPEGLQEMKKRRKRPTRPADVSQPPKQPLVLAASEAADKNVGTTFVICGSDGSTSRLPDKSLALQQIELGSVMISPDNLQASQVFQRASSPRPKSPCGSGVVDPFDTLPPSTCPQTQRLLYYADRGILSSRLMGRLRTEWLSLASQDTAMFHVALSHYAGNYGLAHQQNDPVEALRFRMEAMRMVNERLEDVNSALTDGTLGTVASLSSYEATNGSIAAIQTHRNGLHRLVKLRGGIVNGTLNLYTSRLLLWADLNCANALGSYPSFPIFTDNDESDSPLCFIPAIEARKQWPSILSDAESMPQLEAMTKEMSDDFSALKLFTELGHFPQNDGLDRRNQQIYDSDRLYLIERSLLTLSLRWGPEKFACSGCISATIFVVNHLRSVGFNAQIMDRLVNRLHMSMQLVLEGATHHTAKRNTTRAMLWVLVVGGIAARKGLAREWFLTQLVVFTDILDMQLWEQADAVLKDFLWPSDWQAHGRSLWTGIEEMRTTNRMIWPLNMDAPLALDS